MYRDREMGGQESQIGDKRNKHIIVSEISRGDSFGGSLIFNCPGLDYLGDIVAGD